MSSSDEFLDDPTRRVLLKKVWCHGQAIAPFAGIALAGWGIMAPQMQTAVRAVLILCGLVLPAWSYTSWVCMQRATLFDWHVILGFGCSVELLYTVVLVCLSGMDFTTKTTELVAFVFTALALVETFAYLVVIACMRGLFREQADRGCERQNLV
mmetsp:Transcript_22814/g.56342  ORF Transcript_22814/g.56342 Transcript_22814/m.56342 type:complete len:154 (+) Transcript_22814:1490-1951(+)|eukprot:CAMPEP_0206224796 /NCGR_PEP_ID=MMETSP0047_2-20121206/7213_1 /ASSEMBLY_ACC=CAM_ASM_000192 /TAXON_ID=195065 /ORGANISM="Chroomonas mesostigmatica_cf, Strain CCMP1168" /LENGTH=153 /DNA_ID=CAMNT_0053647769 /DNA_START=1349 /DNA_END=1810 /DNA_ORIENTATION=-